MTLPIDGLAEIIASRTELQHFRDDEWALAYALAGAIHEVPTAEHCTWFIDDAEACSGDVGPGPYTVAMVGDVVIRNFTAVLMVNHWLCAVEEGEGFIEMRPMADLTGWQITKLPEEAS